ncbi:MAG: hypothetical protein JNL64_02575 [Blastocatellia bacterium]|nr:hypothetical protein [Blastocatellia bacterium]
MRQLFLVSILLLGMAIVSSAQNTSVYTSTKTSACKDMSPKTDTGDSYEGECPGVGGYKLRLLEGDIRQTLNVITPAKKKHELNFWGFYSGFSSVGEKVEWRVKKGVPVALIARFNVSDAEDSSKTTSYLMVAKVSAKQSCVVDVIMPGKSQNLDARIAADKAATMPCKTTD